MSSNCLLSTGRYTIRFYPPELIPKYPPKESGYEDIQSRVATHIEELGCVLPNSPVSRGAPVWVDNRWFVAGSTDIGKKPRTGIFHLLGNTKEGVISIEYELNKRTSFKIDSRNYVFKATKMDYGYIMAEITRENGGCNSSKG